MLRGKIYKLVALCCFIFLSLSGSGTADLIEPTRKDPSKSSAEKSMAKGALAVFSEPSGMLVQLDGSKLGLTPLRTTEVSTGIHLLQVGEQSTQIEISPGKPLKISLFKEEFIIVKEKHEAHTVPEQSKAKEPAHSQAPDDKRDSSLDPPSPLYFPINPRGPIY